MNLAQFADYVCQKVGQTDDDSLSACKGFVNRRFQMIWDGALWADSQSLITVSSTAEDPAVIEFPATVGRVLHLRNVGTQSDILGTSIGTIFDYDSGLFAQTGQESRFIHLKTRPTAFASGVGHLVFDASEVEGTDVVTLSVTGGDGNGGILRETVNVVISARREITAIDLTGKTGASLDNSGVGRAFVCNGDASGVVLGVYFSLGSVSAAPDLTLRGVTDYVIVNTSSGDDAATLATSAAAALAPYVGCGTDGNSIQITPADFGAQAEVADYNTGATVTITQAAGVGTTTTTATSFDELYLITSDLYEPSIPMKNEAGGSVGAYSGTVFPVGASSTLGILERVRVYPAPSTVQTYLAHVKTTAVQLTEDTNEPRLAGVENALLAFAQADMLERQRQYAKAAAKMQEGQEQLQIMLDLEKNQQAYDVRIVPAIYGDAYGASGDDSGFSGKGFW